MGYSLSTRFPTEELKSKVLSFLEENYQSWESLAGLEDTHCLRGPTDDLSYGPDDAPAVGFDYSGGDEEVQYAWRLCAWMATLLKAHPKPCGDCCIRVDCLASTECKLIAVCYDGVEDVPLTEFKGIDDIGFWPLSKSSFMVKVSGGRKSTFAFDSLVKAELQRLTDLWQKNVEQV